jgi:hypothetical protein
LEVLLPIPWQYPPTGVRKLSCFAQYRQALLQRT